MSVYRSNPVVFRSGRPLTQAVGASQRTTSNSSIRSVESTGRVLGDRAVASPWRDSTPSSHRLPTEPSSRAGYSSSSSQYVAFRPGASNEPSSNGHQRDHRNLTDTSGSERSERSQRSLSTERERALSGRPASRAFGSSNFPEERETPEDVSRLVRLMAIKEEEIARLSAENLRLQNSLTQASTTAANASFRGGPSGGPASPRKMSGPSSFNGREIHLNLPNPDREEVRRHAVLGGNGSVYRASLGGFTFVLKIVSLADPKALQETEILQQLDHPNIVKYLGYQIAGPRELHILMEYLPFSLEVYMQGLRKDGKRFKERELLRVALEVCKGLHYLHNNAPVQIIHRDLKSKNILVDVDGHNEVQEVKLCDFGVSRILSEGSKADTMVGTYYWMPPEILANDATPYSVEADIWSLGMVMVELTTLRNPYHENNQNWPVTKRMILSGQPPRVDPNTPARFKQLIMACLRLRPEQRPSTRDIMLFLTE